MIATLLFVAFLAMMFVGVPIGAALGLAGAAAIALANAETQWFGLLAVPQNFYAGLGKVLDADVLVACDGGRACNECQGNHQEDGDFFRPGERRIGEVAHQHIGKGDERQGRHDDDGEPVFKLQ